MSTEPRFDLLAEWCLFCHPEKHGQQHQVMLRSTNFYLFAGLGAIIPGYVIIAPYRCEGEGGLRSMAEAPASLLDEVRFLRGIVSHYYRERFGEEELSFEHGRAGSCLMDDRDTRHCYHAHMCCYPSGMVMWSSIQSYRFVELAGMHELADYCGSGPYLYLEHKKVNRTVGADQALRDRWESRVVRLPDDRQLESQYLRRLLATQAGTPERWDWRAFPSVGEAAELARDFRKWLVGTNRYAARESPRGVEIDFYSAVHSANVAGNDAIAGSYRRVWENHIQHDALARFVRHLRPGPDGDVRVLDAACGPAIYLKAMHHLGLRVVGNDISWGMLEEAGQVLVHELAASRRPALVMADTKVLPFRAGSFSGIWYSAGMVHVPRLAAFDTLHGFYQLLQDDGLLYMSFQPGQGVVLRREGRSFYYYSENEVLSLAARCGFALVDKWDDAIERGSMGDNRRKVWKHLVLRKQSAPPAHVPVAESRTLADLGERELLKHIRGRLPMVLADEVVLGNGDDCAALRVPPGEVVVTTVDPCPQPVISIVEGPDPWVEGWYTMAINLSDLAAMGARPVGALLSVEAPNDYQLSALDRFYDGVQDAAAAFRCPILGGNVKDSPRFSCVGVALGSVPAARMLLRSAARPGQSVVVLGNMGIFWAGVLDLIEPIGLGSTDRAVLRDAMRRPWPRVREGELLSTTGWSRCAMDSSDGLISCFYEMAGSGRDIDIHVDLSPVQPDRLVTRVAAAHGIDARKLQLSWGDWQLVCTVERDIVGELSAALSEMGCPIWTVGWVTEGQGRVWMHDEMGTGTLNYVASERFTSQSYFTHGIEQYIEILRNEPLVLQAK